jgi:hypothetical protein
MSKVVKLSFALFLMLSMSAIALAQSEATTGRITGSVKDSQGAAVPNASVTVSNPATGYSQTMTTDENGEFNAVQLKPGDYTVEVTATGFGKSTQTGYHVEVGSALTANIALGVGAVNEEVLITAASVETTQVQTTTNINDTAISQLPINGRRFQDFVLATPGAQIDPQRGQISLSGQRGINGNVQIDGGDYNNPFFGGLRGGERSNQAFTIPQGAVREFQVVASGYNAEFGRSTGGIVNVVTKSGTNDFSGSAFYVIRPQKYAHKNAFSQIAAPTQKQWGGALGGPLYLPRFGEGGRSTVGGKDRSFFFVAFEQQSLQQTRAVLMNNLRQAGINSGTIASGITEALEFSLGLEGPYNQTNNAKVFLTRLDFNLNQQNQLSFRYNYSVNTALNAVTAGTSLTPTTNSALSNNGTEGDDSNTFVGQLTSFLTPTVVNELRAQYSKENRPRLANELSPELRANYGLFGTVNFLPTTQNDYRIQFADNLTMIRGSHTVKVGGEYNYSKASQVFAFRQFGSFSFNFTGTGAADVISVLRILSVGGNSTTANANGNVTGTIVDPTNRFDDTRARYGRQVGNGLLTLSSPQYAAFAQDSWRVNSRLTLNFGLRYEAQLMPQPDTSNSALTNAVLSSTLPLGAIDPRSIADQTKQWAPRGGFAWDFVGDGKGVIRGYTGIYYAATPLLTLAAPLNNFRTPPGDVTLNLPTACPSGSALPSSINSVYRQFNSIGINLNNFPLSALPVLSIAQVQQITSNVATACNQTFNTLSGLQVVAGTDDLRNPRSFQAGIGVEREIARGLTVGANFDYVKTDRLTFNRDYDLPTPLVRAGDASRRPFFGIVSPTVLGAQNRPITALGNAGYVQVRDSSARSLYKALTVRAQLRRKFGQFDAFYVFAKNRDSDSTERNATFATYENAFDLGPEYNFGALDRRHVFSVNTIIHAPWGFEIAMNGRILSGAPIDVSVSGIVAPAGSGLTAAQYAALVTLSGSTTGDLNQDTTFPDRPFVAPGVSSLRNSYRNRGLKFADLRVQRNFRFGEKYELSPSLEVFNVFDFQNITYSSTTATNYGNPGINEKTGEVLAPSNPTFLALRNATGDLLLTNSPGAPLQIQFGLRFKF